MNNKGFTLIELIVTIVILAIIMSIGTYSIISIINSTRQTNYELLIKHIKEAVETYVIECKYAKDGVNSCSNGNEITLGDLVRYGYLTGNGKNSNNHDTYDIYDTRSNELISNCKIAISYDEIEKTLKIDQVNSNDSVSGNDCPVYETIYYAFGNPTTSSPTNYRKIVNQGHKVFVALYSDGSKAACSVINEKLGCFKNGASNWTNNKSNIQAFFSGDNCTVTSTNVLCFKDDIECEVSKSGYVFCGDYIANDGCDVDGRGNVSC